MSPVMTWSLRDVFAELVALGEKKGMVVQLSPLGDLTAATSHNARPWFVLNSGHLPDEWAAAMLRGALHVLPDVVEKGSGPNVW